MSLNFDFTDMRARLGNEEYDRITNHPNPDCNELHPVTDAMIWLCLLVGMPGVTEKNVDKFTARVLAYQGANGGYLDGPDGSVWITGEDVRNHIGLRTNVPLENDSKFYAKLYRMSLDEGRRAERLQNKSAHAVAKELAEKRAAA